MRRELLSLHRRKQMNRGGEKEREVGGKTGRSRRRQRNKGTRRGGEMFKSTYAKEKKK